MNCIECGGWVSIERDHRDYKACGRVKPHRYGLLRKLMDAPQWCPIACGFDGVDVDPMTDEWKPYKLVKDFAQNGKEEE